MITDMSDSVLVDGVLCCFYDAAMLCFNHAMLQLLLCCYATLCCAMLLCYYCAILLSAMLLLCYIDGILSLPGVVVHELGVLLSPFSSSYGFCGCNSCKPPWKKSALSQR